MGVLVTGGAGYIGSHLVRELSYYRRDIIVLDNLSMGHIEAVPKDLIFERVDILNRKDLEIVFQKHKIDTVFHFAAFAYVGESVENPYKYYQNNVFGSINLIDTAVEYGVESFIFSSTCSLYGNPEIVPITEREIVKPINPYARTKFIIEQVLYDYYLHRKMKYVCLRYFNAAGASFDGEIGESHDPEPHLIPLVLFTGLGKRDSIKVFGNDYPTSDGTCIRDYIHVVDLADAHIKALEYLRSGGEPTFINLGTGEGNSVKEVIDKTKEITGLDIPCVIVGRREGDPAILVADNEKAKTVLQWEPKYGLKDIISSAYNWHKNQKF